MNVPKDEALSRTGLICFALIHALFGLCAALMAFHGYSSGGRWRVALVFAVVSFLVASLYTFMASRKK